MHRILIPLLTLAVFLWLAWYSLHVTPYDVQGLNALTDRLAVTKPVNLYRPANERERAKAIADLWGIEVSE